MTEWREIPGWEGLYAVSDDGQVKSLPRPRRKLERLLVPQRELERPYWFVTLWVGKKPFHRRVHNLVLEAFAGPRPAGAFGLHNDDNPDNNHISNLRWGTRSENTYDMIRNGKHNHAGKTHCKHGHLLAGDNLIIGKRQRFCRACKRRRQNEYDQRQRDALAVYVADTKYGKSSMIKRSSGSTTPTKPERNQPCP